MDPGLRAGTVDFHRWREGGGIVERAGQHERYIRQDIGLGDDARSAIRAEPAPHLLSGIAGIVIGLQPAVDADRSRRKGDDGLESGAGIALAVAAVAQAAEERDRRSACSGPARTGSRRSDRAYRHSLELAPSHRKTALFAGPASEWPGRLSTDPGVLIQFECHIVIPGRGHSLRTRNPGTQALKILEKPVFVDSGLGPRGPPRNDNSVFYIEIETLPTRGAGRDPFSYLVGHGGSGP